MPSPLMSPYYRPQTRGGYQPQRRGNSSLYYTDGTKIPGARINASVQRATMMGGPDEGPISKRGNKFVPDYKPKTRQDNIDAARADGTFDAKRAAFNAANKGSYMDEKGTIGPKAPLPTGNPANERVPVSTPSTPPATTPPAAKPEVMGPPRPATFEGKSRAEWFGAAAKSQGENNAYSNEALATSNPQAKPAAPSAPGDKQMQALGNAAKLAEEGQRMITNLPKPTPSTPVADLTTPTPAGVPPPTFDNPAAKERYNQAMSVLSEDKKKPQFAANRPMRSK